MTDKELFCEILNEAKKRKLIPKTTRVMMKADSRLHRAINWLLNKVYSAAQQDSYLNGATTTLRYKIAFSSRVADRVEDLDDWFTLLHELKHVRQCWREGIVAFGFKYLWPISQGLSLLLVSWLPFVFLSTGLALMTFAVLLAAIGAHFVPQLPDPWRKRYEMEAYTVTLACYKMVHNRIPAEVIEHVASHFTGMMYYKMSMDAKAIKNELHQIEVGILADIHPVLEDPLIVLAKELRERNEQECA